jgi:hypothetical protein
MLFQGLHMRDGYDFLNLETCTDDNVFVCINAINGHYCLAKKT